MLPEIDRSAVPVFHRLGKLSDLRWKGGVLTLFGEPVTSAPVIEEAWCDGVFGLLWVAVPHEGELVHFREAGEDAPFDLVRMLRPIKGFADALAGMLSGSALLEPQPDLDAVTDVVLRLVDKGFEISGEVGLRKGFGAEDTFCYREEREGPFHQPFDPELRVRQIGTGVQLMRRMARDIDWTAGFLDWEMQTRLLEGSNLGPEVLDPGRITSSGTELFCDGRPARTRVLAALQLEKNSQFIVAVERKDLPPAVVLMRRFVYPELIDSKHFVHLLSPEALADAVAYMIDTPVFQNKDNPAARSFFRLWTDGVKAEFLRLIEDCARHEKHLLSLYEHLHDPVRHPKPED